jgi:hypothetical protein
MSRRSVLDHAVSVALILSSIAIATVVVYRNFAPAREVRIADAASVQLSDSLWTALIATAHLEAGSPAARVTIVELTDLECPACRGFQAAVEAVAQEWPRDVRILYVPHPLSYHRFAMAAANAAECASRAGALTPWIQTVFTKQDSLGLKSWGNYAAEAGITDTAGIAECARSSKPHEAVQRGLALGTAIGLNGTPTIVLNGQRLGGVPSADELKDMVREALRRNGEASQARRQQAKVTPTLPVHSFADDRAGSFGSSAEAPVSSITIAGRILDSASSRGLAHATIEMLRTDQQHGISVLSDSTGSFVIRFSPGKYRMRVSRPHYQAFLGNPHEIDTTPPFHIIALAKDSDGAERQ